MEIVFTVLILLMAVAASGVIAKLVPFNLPLPLFQIALGAVLALPLFGLKISFDPELFLLLFIPPLLFTDGWRIPKREFFRLARPILALALGLVFLTVVVIGYLIHWIIPVIPLPVAFALAAVISPTDAVAVGAIVGKGRLPPTLQHLLEGEALMNDASGLVACKFALIALMSGVFSLVDASISFVMISVGGILMGLAVAWCLGFVRRKVIDWSGDEPGIQVVLTLLIPFVAYIFAEHFELSGILSAVAAGMLMPYIETASAESAATRLQRDGMLTMLEFVFNGMSFILLGLQLPGILDLAHADAQAAGDIPVWYLFAYIGAITGALIVFRLVWVWINLRFRSFASLLLKGKWDQSKNIDFRLMLITAFSGVRGAVTLAGVMSFPLFLTDGSPFPARDLLIFLATGVILYSLISATIILPFLLKGLHLDDVHKLRKIEEMRARQRISEAAIHSIEQTQQRLSENLEGSDLKLLEEVSKSLLATYHMRMDADGDSEEAHQIAVRFRNFEWEIRSAILIAERKEVQRMHAQQLIDDELYMEFMSQIDLAETWQKGSLSKV